MSAAETKTASIVADNYKVERFKKELTDKGFIDFEVIPFRGTDHALKGTTAIKVKVPADQLDAVKKICQRVELHFKRGN